MSTVSSLTTALQQAGMRLTPQRIEICKVLSESENHPTASMIYNKLRPKYSSLSLATVYNTLDTLVKLGVINVLGHAGDDHVHYDPVMEPHANLACVSCHRILDIPSEHVQHVYDEINQTSGYKLLGARVLYYGLCPDCQSKSAETNQTW